MENSRQYAWRSGRLLAADESRPVAVGELIFDFRGEEWTFCAVSQEADGASSGRVLVTRPCPSAYDRSPSMGGGRECVHMWHPDGVITQEFFPSVFDLYLGDAQGVEAA